VRDFADTAFQHAGLSWKDYVRYDATYERPSEVEALIGDPSKAESALGWKAQTHAPELARLMVEADVEFLRKEAREIGT
jgi:GDPmannose 4,6-dehydratase